MLKKRSWIFILIFIAVSILFFRENRKLNTTLENLENEVQTQKNQTSANGSSSPETTPVGGATQIHSGEQSTESEALKFNAWFENEAALLDQAVSKTEEREADLKIKASQLSPDEVQLLQAKVTNVQAKANERIMATYLLSLGVENTQAALIEISKMPLSLSSPQPVHSLGESQIMHEKSLRIMAIDELFNRAKSDAALRENYLKTAQAIPDPSLKQYALKRYRELK